MMKKDQKLKEGIKISLVIRIKRHLFDRHRRIQASFRTISELKAEAFHGNVVILDLLSEIVYCCAIM